MCVVLLVVVNNFKALGGGNKTEERLLSAAVSFDRKTCAQDCVLGNALGGGEG